MMYFRYFGTLDWEVRFSNRKLNFRPINESSFANKDRLLCTTLLCTTHRYAQNKSYQNSYNRKQLSRLRTIRVFRTPWTLENWDKQTNKQLSKIHMKLFLAVQHQWGASRWRQRRYGTAQGRHERQRDERRAANSDAFGITRLHRCSKT